MSAVRFEVGSGDIDEFDIGSAGNVTLDLREQLAEAAIALGDDGDPDGGPLPLVVVIDLGDRQPVLVTQPVDDRAHGGPLRFQGPALRNVEVEADGSRMHTFIVPLPAFSGSTSARVPLRSGPVPAGRGPPAPGSPHSIGGRRRPSGWAATADRGR